jgi:ribonuclease D
VEPAAALVTRREEIEEVAAAARERGRIALDTEFIRERTYRARLCLVQVATEDSITLIDALAESDLGPVIDLLSDAAVELVVHAGRQDLAIVHDLFGAVPRRVFDVQVAAGFAGYGASLPLGRLVESVTGVSLAKGESYTDWCRRPLTPAQLTYAAQDVRYLLPVADRLAADLDRRGRSEWLREEMRALESARSYGLDPTEAWQRVAGRGALTPRQTAVLREVAAWRERTAARRDVPRGWIVKDPTLIEIARRKPANLRQLKSIRGLNQREAERSAAALLDAVAVGSRAEPVEPDTGAWPRSVLGRARIVAGVADALARARCEAADVAPELVATRGELEALLADVIGGRLDRSRHRVLQGWRGKLVGRHVVALARGEIALRIIDGPPYVQEVSV